MHQYIFQIFGTPTPEEDWISAETFWEHPDVLPVADTVSPVSSRSEAIAHFGAWLERKQLGLLSGETFYVTAQAADRYFKGRFPAFRQAVSALEQATEQQFIHAYCQVQKQIDDLSRAFVDRYDTYVMMDNDFPPLPMDAFLRIAQPNTPYYIGAVLDFRH